MPAISYEITAFVRDDLTAEFERYMAERHIPDVMATGAFEASWLKRGSTGQYRISYRSTREDLDNYLRDHAQGLRSHVAKTFPEGVKLSREEWEIIATF